MKIIDSPSVYDGAPRCSKCGFVGPRSQFVHGRGVCLFCYRCRGNKGGAARASKAGLWGPQGEKKAEKP